jgi:hypothetical protein
LVVRRRGRSRAAWPLAARAQQGERMRRIGALMEYDENDPLAKSQLSEFTHQCARQSALAGLFNWVFT